MTITSYAQNFEDVILWRSFSSIKRGCYIDIGAQDPTVDSVSLLFHEHGWSGVHVEPVPYYADLLRQNRQGDVVIQAVVSDESSIIRFFEIPGTGISTADEIIANQHKERGFEPKETIVPCIPLHDILDSSGAIDVHWLKIDVEGFERRVLLSWGDSDCRPWVVLVESTVPLTRIESHDQWESLLIALGYQLAYFDGLNRYYVHKAHQELTKFFDLPPNIFDDFSLSGTASAPFTRLIQERFQRELILSHEKHLENLASLRTAEAEARAKIEEFRETIANDAAHARAKVEGLLQKLADREWAHCTEINAIHQKAAAELAESERLRVATEIDLRERFITSNHAHAMREQALIARIERIQYESDKIKSNMTVIQDALRKQLEEERELARHARFDANTVRRELEQIKAGLIWRLAGLFRAGSRKVTSFQR